MSKIFCVFALMAFVLASTNAQPYQSIFGSHSTRWIILWENLDFASYQDYYVVKDTMLSNGFSYKKIISDYEPVHLLLREDTTTGKIWSVNLDRYCRNPLLLEKLVQDLSLQPGDTFNINASDMIGNGSADSLRVVDSVYFANGHKHIRLASIIDGPLNTEKYGIKFIEGTGPNRSVIWMRADCRGHFDQYLLCAYKDGIKTDYVNENFNGECAPVLTDVASLSVEAKFSIYPNPTFDHVIVSGDMQIKEVLVTDISGRLCNVSIHESEIDVSSLSKGLYFVTISGNKSRTTRKLLKL